MDKVLAARCFVLIGILILQLLGLLMTTLMQAMAVKRRWFFPIGLERQEVQMPQMKDSDVLIKVSAAGVNRGDIYDVLTGSSGLCPELECSGIIVAVGRNVHSWQVGERVCAILDGRGYAEQVVVPENLLLPLPDNIDLHDAAGLPFISCSIWLALSKVPKPASLLDKTILIHEGTSEIGMLAIQYAKYWGLKVIASTGSDKNLAICSHYGADLCINHTRWNLVSWVKNITQGLGVNFVLDYGSCNLKTSLECCAAGVRCCISMCTELKEVPYNSVSYRRIIFKSKFLIYKVKIWRIKLVWLGNYVLICGLLFFNRELFL